ncbi:uncharacterized protein VTP21DRAFT_8466 [Calcarisporiella thermophila]|uniref:uncharacterized protein n=1 Tax=Calcarisporiella thermophila TaxID=911321 RepID=UPI0037426791
MTARRVKLLKPSSLGKTPPCDPPVISVSHGHLSPSSPLPHLDDGTYSITSTSSNNDTSIDTVVNAAIPSSIQSRRPNTVSQLRLSLHDATMVNQDLSLHLDPHYHQHNRHSKPSKSALKTKSKSAPPTPTKFVHFDAGNLEHVRLFLQSHSPGILLEDQLEDGIASEEEEIGVREEEKHRQNRREE